MRMQVESTKRVDVTFEELEYGIGRLKVSFWSKEGILGNKQYKAEILSYGESLDERASEGDHVMVISITDIFDGAYEGIINLTDPKWCGFGMTFYESHFDNRTEILFIPREYFKNRKILAEYYGRRD